MDINCSDSQKFADDAHIDKPFRRNYNKKITYVPPRLNLAMNVEELTDVQELLVTEFPLLLRVFMTNPFHK